MLMDTNGERKIHKTVLIFFTENIESAGVCLFQHFKPKAKGNYLCLAPEERTLTFWLSSKYQKHHHFKV